MSGQGRGEIRALLDRHDVRPVKRLGQHFLADPNLVDRIVRTAAVGPGDSVVEIGPGTGSLTLALADTGARVVAYEVDERLRPLLEETLTGRDVELRWADAARLDLSADLGGGRWTMVANLPYNVGSGIVLDALRADGPIDRFVVMVQREVADRLLASPGSKTYGLPSVIVSLHAAGSVAFSVAASVFVPPPDVDSAVVVLDRIEAPADAEEAIRLAAAAFGQRRKMLRRSLASELVDAEAVLAAAGVDPTARAEDLQPTDFVAIAQVAA